MENWFSNWKIISQNRIGTESGDCSVVCTVLCRSADISIGDFAWQSLNLSEIITKSEQGEDMKLQ